MEANAITGSRSEADDPAPKKLAQADLDAAVRVITFCDLPPDLEAVSPVERWKVPPVSVNYVKSRDAILANLEQLLREMAE